MKNKFSATLNYEEKIIVECTPVLIFINAKKYWHIDEIIEFRIVDNKATIINNHQEILEIDDAIAFSLYVQKHYRYNKIFNPKKYWYYKNQVGIVISIIVAGFIILCIAGYLFIEYNAYKLISVKREHQIGEELYSQIISQYEINDSASFYMQQFLDTMHWQTNFPIKVTIVKNNQVNAFAMPGGYIIIYDSIIRETKNYEQLAGLLGHELSHIELRHSLRAILSNMSSALVLSFILGRNTLSNIIVNISQLKYSRNLEIEADQNSALLLMQKQIDPLALFYLFQEMKNKEKNSSMLEILSTHPDFENREIQIKKTIKDKNYTIVKNKTLENLYKKIKKSVKTKTQKKEKHYAKDISS